MLRQIRYGLGGNLHMLSAVECLTLKARLKGCCSGRSLMKDLGSFISTWACDCCLMSKMTGDEFSLVSYS